MRLKRTYSSREVTALTGLTARQLQIWDAAHLLSPASAELRHRGFSIAQLHAIVRVLKDQFGVRLFEATGGGGSVRLLTDGREIYARVPNGAVFNVLKSPAQPLLVVGDEGLLKELGGRLRRRRSRTRSR